LFHVLGPLNITNSAAVSFQNCPPSVVESKQAGSPASSKLIGIERVANLGEG